MKPRDVTPSPVPVQALPEVLPRQIGGEEINAVDGRDLHAALQIGKRYTTWALAQIDSLELVQGIDYEGFRGVSPERGINPAGGRPRDVYAFTLDVAKHIAMASRTAKGREVRDYFIECEKRLAMPPELSKAEMTLMVIEGLQEDVKLERAARMLAECTAASHAIKIEEDAPAVAYVERLKQADGGITTTAAVAQHGETLTRQVWEDMDQTWFYRLNPETAARRWRKPFVDDGTGLDVVSRVRMSNGGRRLVTIPKWKMKGVLRLGLWLEQRSKQLRIDPTAPDPSAKSAGATPRRLC